MEEYLDDLPVQDDLLRKSALLCAEWHDLGKATRFFQDHLRGSRVSGKLSSHALLSAVLTLWNHARELPLEWKLPLFLVIILRMSFVIPACGLFWNASILLF